MVGNAVKTIESSEILSGIEEMAMHIAERHFNDTSLVLVGIARGGVDLSRMLANYVGRHLNRQIPVGTLDISFHRDDIGHSPITKVSDPSDIPMDIDHATVVLVDDVMESGRTARAALNELFDYGRPEKVELAILVDRGGRKLPIRPDYVAFHEQVQPGQKVVVQLNTEESEQSQIVFYEE